MNKLLLLILLSALLACGPSAEEKARLQKAREDSIKLATEQADKMRLERALALKDDIRNMEAKKEGQSTRADRSHS